MADRVLRPPLELSDTVFLYGTLCDPELFRIVSGAPFNVRPARLDDIAVHWAAGESFPVPTTQPGAVANGVIADVDEDARSRLDFYELGFGYRTEERVVSTDDGDVTAVIYVPGRAWPAGSPWSLADWQAEHGALTRVAAREYMTLMDTHLPEEAARTFPQVRMRAASKLRAEAEPSPEPLHPKMAHSVVRNESTKRPYTDYFAVQEDWLAFPRFDGTHSSVVKRASFMGGDAVTVLPYDPETDQVMMIRQFRHGPFVRGDRNPWTLEPAAGRIDPGETPEETARRELLEETDIAANDLHFIGRYYPTPGAFSEYLFSYVAISDLSDADGGVGGLEDEAEDIMRHVVPLQDALQMIEDGGVNTGPLILSLTWLALNRERLR